jgi:CheY-like chemotaxis protein
MDFEPGSLTKPILFVEDNLTNQFVLQEIAELFELNGQFVEDGLTCLERLRDTPEDEPFAVIVMDCMMPKMDGYETTRCIRSGEAGEQYRDVPILAMTANAMSGDREECLAAGMADYLMKPIQISDLLAMLKKWVA